MSATLVIVESPGKVATIKKILGKGYDVIASVGHIRDLPSAGLSIDIENGFEPQYEINPDKTEVVRKIKSAAKDAKRILLATDPDQEGEAIAFHLAHILGLSGDCRITFNAITPSAVAAGIAKPREINQNLVNAQQARRVVDRLVGYKVSPVLWDKVAKGTSAGRCQSVALRIVAEREVEITRFKMAKYWTIHAPFLYDGKQYEATLVRHNGKAITIDSLEKANDIVKDLSGKKFKVSDSSSKLTNRKPNPPFITSSLQQAASSILGYQAKRAMQLAQKLYEGLVVTGQTDPIGLITYMRTDSPRISDEGLAAARAIISSEYGKKYLPSSPRVYGKSGAQDAHEAVRPTHFEVHADMIRGAQEEARLYDLIYKRFIASQMEDAVVRSNVVVMKIGDYEFEIRGSLIEFDGWTKVYPLNMEEASVPMIKVGTEIVPGTMSTKEHQTKPPPRYSEASLIACLEKNGIGRPSTYAAIITTLTDRGYAKKEGKNLVLTDIGLLVNDFLVANFPDIVDIQFTAKMETDLDLIRDGHDWKATVATFYGGLSGEITTATKTAKKVRVLTDVNCRACDKKMTVLYGKNGSFLSCSGYPKCKTTAPLPDGFSVLPWADTYRETGVEVAEKLSQELEKLEPCPECEKGQLIERRSKFGKFWGCNAYPNCKFIKKIQEIVMPCPACEVGGIVKKTNKEGKPFYACNKYPDCTQLYSAMPTDKKCAECGSLIMVKGKVEGCSDKDCSKAFPKTFSKSYAKGDGSECQSKSRRPRSAGTSKKRKK